MLCFCFSSTTFANSQIHYEKALSAFNQEHFDESMIHLKNALKEDTDNLPAKILMGKLLTQLGRFEMAKVEFDEVIMQGADISSFSSFWALTLLKQKSYEKLIDFNEFSNFSIAQKIEWQRFRASACMLDKYYKCAKQSYILIGELADNQAEKFNGLAQVALVQKEYSEAERFLSQAMQVNPKHATTWQLKGLVARSQNNLGVALEYLQKAFKLAPDNPYILRHLADLYLASNKSEQAKEAVNDILIASPNDPFAILVNSWLHKNTELEADAEQKFKAMAAKINNLPDEYVAQEESLLFLRALVAFREQQFESAVRDFSSLRKLDDRDISPSILLAKSYIALGKEKNAVKILEEKEKELQALPDVMAMLGDLYINSGKNFKALSLLDTLKIQFPNNLQVKLLEAKLMISRGQSQQGLAFIEKLTIDYPDNSTVLFVHCVLSLQTQQFEKADVSISKLLELQPNDPLKLNIKGAVLLKLNQIDQAQTYIKQALSLKPNLISAKINLASTYFLQNEFAQSIKILDEILVFNPRYTPALLLLAKIQLTKGELQPALTNYRKVLISNRQNIEALEGYTSVLLAKNELTNALTQLNKLSNIQANHPKYVIQKAQIYLTLKDDINSQHEITKLTRLATGNAALLIALSKLQILANDLPAAIESLNSAQQAQPKSLKLGVQFAELLLNNKQTELATKQVKLLVRKFPGSADVTFLQARLAEQQGNLEQANTLYLKTLEMNDQYELALAKMYALIGHGVPDTPFKNKIDSIVETYPERYFPRNLLAQYYYYKGEFKDAAYHYEILLKHQALPNKAAMLTRLANTYMFSDLETSFTYAKQAFELDATDQQVLTTYGWLLTQKKQANKGLELLRKALARGQQNPAIHYYIAASLEQLGLTQEAKSELETLFAKKVLIAENDQAKALYDKL
jgi:putative PEP-CTERM system TPR-repeat lipoprotein